MRRLAAAARDVSDKAFWLGLAERWQAARQRCLRQALGGDFSRRKEKHGPSWGNQAAATTRNREG
jgi:hypothetical protein